MNVEGRCLKKLESILEEFAACLTHLSSCWALLRELIRRDGITPTLVRVNHHLKETGLRLDFHFAPSRHSRGRTSRDCPSMHKH